MKFFRLPILVGLLFLASCSEEALEPTGPAETPAEAPMPHTGADELDLTDRYIVVFKNDVGNPNELTDELMAHGQGQVHFRYRHAIKGFAATIPEQALEGIRRNPNVDYIEPDGIVTAGGTQSNPPNWGLDRIDQQNLPLNSQYVYPNDGSEVTVYIIDTGIRMDHQEYNGRASSGWDYIDNDADASDCHGHGTHVAGTVGGTNVGVAKGCNLVAVRVLSCSGSGSYSTVIAGVDWVTQNHSGPSVANMSLGGGYSASLNQAVNSSVSSGVVYAVSAGNSNANACNYSPASASGAITVGSSTSSDYRSSFSNYGSCVDIFAPGSGIYSSTMNSTNSYASWSGTSMASPHVAGVAALYLHANTSATPSQATSAILGGATSGVLSNIGTNSPNLLLYSQIAGGSGPSAPSAPGNLNLTNVTTTSIRVNWTDNSSDEDGFKIERSLNGSSWSQIATVGANTTTYNNTGLASSTTYYYRARAYNTGGNSGYSNTDNATTLAPPPPTAPSNLNLTNVTSNSIRVNWTDNSSDEDGFKIERSPDGSSWSQIATVGANTTTYNNTGLASSTTYYYRARAYNSGGNSGYSNTANATTAQQTSTKLHVATLSGTATSQRSNWYGHLTVTVYDESNNPVAGVTVQAAWGGNSGSGTTDASGQCTISSTAYHKKVKSFDMDITNLSKSGYTYDSGSNAASTYTFYKP